MSLNEGLQHAPLYHPQPERHRSWLQPLVIRRPVDQGLDILPADVGLPVEADTSVSSLRKVYGSHVLRGDNAPPPFPSNMDNLPSTAYTSDALSFGGYPNGPNFLSRNVQEKQ